MSRPSWWSGSRPWISGRRAWCAACGSRTSASRGRAARRSAPARRPLRRCSDLAYHPARRRAVSGFRLVTTPAPLQRQAPDLVSVSYRLGTT